MPISQYQLTSATRDELRQVVSPQYHRLRLIGRVFEDHVLGRAAGKLLHEHGVRMRTHRLHKMLKHTSRCLRNEGSCASSMTVAMGLVVVTAP